jgi:hypothetical protein
MIQIINEAECEDTMTQYTNDEVLILVFHRGRLG